jgi:hypothetical protein
VCCVGVSTHHHPTFTIVDFPHNDFAGGSLSLHFGGGWLLPWVPHFVVVPVSPCLPSQGGSLLPFSGVNFSPSKGTRCIPGKQCCQLTPFKSLQSNKACRVHTVGEKGKRWQNPSVKTYVLLACPPCLLIAHPVKHFHPPTRATFPGKHSQSYNSQHTRRAYNPSQTIRVTHKQSHPVNTPRQNTPRNTLPRKPSQGSQANTRSKHSQTNPPKQTLAY